ncbi:hypothetical protein [Tropicimonas sp.]|uniref:hypothetical protein n=1 Tax=Tropicimonas sp. TaxID=2067044 RepID=UPI003A87BE4F
MIANELPDTNAAIARLMRDKLGAGPGDSLAQAMRKGGRRLPNPLRQEGRYLVEQEAMWHNPRLRRAIDPAKIRRAQQDLTDHLEKIDRWDAFLGRTVGILAPLMFNVLLIFAIVVVWLVKTGRV